MKKVFNIILDWFFWFLLVCSVFPLTAEVLSYFRYIGTIPYAIIINITLFIFIFCVIKFAPFHNVAAAVTSAVIYLLPTFLFDYYNRNNFLLFGSVIISTLLVVLAYNALKKKNNCAKADSERTKRFKIFHYIALLVLLIPVYLVIAFNSVDILNYFLYDYIENILPLEPWHAFLYNTGMEVGLYETLLFVFDCAFCFLLAVLFMRFSPNKWLSFIILNALVIIPAFIINANDSTGHMVGVIILAYWFILFIPTLLLGMLYNIRRFKKLSMETAKEESGEIESNEEGIEI